MSDLPAGPWSRRDFLVVLALNAAGFAVIIAGWVWASGRSLFESQFGAANLTIVGLIVAAAGNVTWLVSGWREVGRVKLALFASRDEP